MNDGGNVTAPAPKTIQILLNKNSTAVAVRVDFAPTSERVIKACGYMLSAAVELASEKCGPIATWAVGPAALRANGTGFDVNIELVNGTGFESKMAIATARAAIESLGWPAADLMPLAARASK
jgi:hypothetical protein